jgi:hypothetical protein
LHALHVRQWTGEMKSWGATDRPLTDIALLLHIDAVDKCVALRVQRKTAQTLAVESTRRFLATAWQRGEVSGSIDSWKWTHG